MAETERTHKEPIISAAAAQAAEEFEAGYKARLEDVAECLTATPSWSAGWQEANREGLGIAVSQSTPDSLDGTRTPWSLFGTGRQARQCELPFDELCPDSWKRSWVEADIAFGLAPRQPNA